VYSLHNRSQIGGGHDQASGKFLGLSRAQLEEARLCPHEARSVGPRGCLRTEKPNYSKRMASSGMLRRVALVRTDVSEELSSSFIRVTRIGELGTTLAVTINRRTLRRNTKFSYSWHPYDGGAKSSETSVPTRAPRRKTPENAILHSHRRENLKS
jgi:hypothetical protein